MAAPTVRSTANVTQGSGATVTIPVPSGTASGDVLIAVVEARINDVTGVPSGWTLIRAGTSGNLRLRTYYKVAGSEPASYDWTLAGSSVATGLMIAVQSAADPASNAIENAGNLGTARFQDCPAVTPSDNDSLLLWIDAPELSNTPVDPSGTTRVVYINNAGDCDLMVARSTQATGGVSSGTKQWDAGVGAFGNFLSQTLALAPGGGGGGVVIPVFAHHYRQQGIA